MPNHVINEVILHGKSLSEVSEKILNKDDEIDFSILLPLPLNHWSGSVGRHHEKAFPGNHLDDARMIWGTKWNAYGLNEGGKYQSVSDGDAGTKLIFQTAWNHPRGWVVAIFNHFKCDISARWLSEGGVDGYAESYDYSKLSWSSSEILDGSDDHKRLHKMLWGVESLDDE